MVKLKSIKPIKTRLILSHPQRRIIPLSGMEVLPFHDDTHLTVCLSDVLEASPKAFHVEHRLQHLRLGVQKLIPTGSTPDVSPLLLNSTLTGTEAEMENVGNSAGHRGFGSRAVLVVE
jgi:hypothetical protein